MARLARIVAPGCPHHVTQRGNRRQQTLFIDDDYRAYLALMAEWCGRYGSVVWAYCLMPNHVHLVCDLRVMRGSRPNPVTCCLGSKLQLFLNLTGATG